MDTLMDTFMDSHIKTFIRSFWLTLTSPRILIPTTSGFAAIAIAYIAAKHGDTVLSFLMCGLGVLEIDRGNHYLNEELDRGKE